MYLDSLEARKNGTVYLNSPEARNNGTVYLNSPEVRKNGTVSQSFDMCNFKTSKNRKFHYTDDNLTGYLKS